MTADSGELRFGFTLDEKIGLLVATASGFWTVEDARAYVGELRRRVDGCRQQFGRVYLLVDAANTEVQSQAVIEVFAGLDDAIVKCPADRAATLAKSSLAKMQMRRSYTSPQVQAFLSRDAAMT